MSKELIVKKDTVDVSKLNIVEELNQYRYECNDEITRSSISKFLDKLLFKRSSVYDFIVICDEVNNTSNSISNNELHVDIILQVNFDSESVIPINIELK